MPLPYNHYGICHSERSEESALAFPRKFYIYILSSKSRRLNVGMTNSLVRRVLEHKRGEVEFTSRYNINRLVYFEVFRYVNNCIARETELKTWSRAKSWFWSMNSIRRGKTSPQIGMKTLIEKQIPHFVRNDKFRSAYMARACLTPLSCASAVETYFLSILVN
jgi:putative endonuclease